MMPNMGSSQVSVPSFGNIAAVHNCQSLVGEWETWARAAGQSSGEQRNEAVSRLKAFLGSELADKVLDLSGLNLSTLPDHLPPSVQVLKLNGNQLQQLPN